MEIFFDDGPEDDGLDGEKLPPDLWATQLPLSAEVSLDPNAAHEWHLVQVGAFLTWTCRRCGLRIALPSSEDPRDGIAESMEEKGCTERMIENVHET